MRRFRHVATIVAMLCLTWSCASIGSSDAGPTARVDLLTEACELGDLDSCDELAVEPAARAEERSFGATCGQRRASPGGSCGDLLGSTTTSTPGQSDEPECLALGARGADVRDLQQRLNAAGAEPPLVVDGELGPRTEAAMEAIVGMRRLCDGDRAALEQEQADFVTVPDVRRVEAAGAADQVETAGLVVTSIVRCSEVVDVGEIVAVRYTRADGRTLTVFDAEVPVNSETLLVPPERTIDLLVSSGSCAAGVTTTSSP